MQNAVDSASLRIASESCAHDRADLLEPARHRAAVDRDAEPCEPGFLAVQRQAIAVSTRNRADLGREHLEHGAELVVADH